MKAILALDQGTTSSRAIVFNHDGTIVTTAQQEFQQIFPQPGWVEHDANEIWQTQLATAQTALKKAGLSAADIAAIGITNQRETTLLWDRKTGQPIHNAIVWQDRRTADLCAKLKGDGVEWRRSSPVSFQGSPAPWNRARLPRAALLPGHDLSRSAAL